MNKQELSAMIADILGSLNIEPMVKGSDYKPLAPQPEQKEWDADGFVEDVTKLNLRKLYLVDNPVDGEKFRFGQTYQKGKE